MALQRPAPLRLLHHTMTAPFRQPALVPRAQLTVMFPVAFRGSTRLRRRTRTAACWLQTAAAGTATEEARLLSRQQLQLTSKGSQAPGGGRCGHLPVRIAVPPAAQYKTRAPCPVPPRGRSSTVAEASEGNRQLTGAAAAAAAAASSNCTARLGGSAACSFSVSCGAAQVPAAAAERLTPLFHLKLPSNKGQQHPREEQRLQTVRPCACRSYGAIRGSRGWACGRGRSRESDRRPRRPDGRRLLLVVAGGHRRWSWLQLLSVKGCCCCSVSPHSQRNLRGQMKPL